MSTMETNKDKIEGPSGAAQGPLNQESSKIDFQANNEAYKKNPKHFVSRIPFYSDGCYKLLFLGAVQAGKSCLINTILSATREMRMQLARSASSDKSITTEYAEYQLQSPDKDDIPIVICDTMGYEETANPTLRDIGYIMEGQIANGYQFTQEGIGPEDDRFLKESTQNVHLIVIVWDGVSGKLQEDVVNKLKEVIKVAQDKKIQCCVLITKVDKLCEDVGEDLEQVFKSKSIKDKINEVAEELGIEIPSIFALKNYTDEVDMDLSINCLVRHILTKMLDLADMTMQTQHKPTDMTVDLLKQPWKVMDWQKEEKDMIPELEAFVQPGFPCINILMVGLISSGKSSYINAVMSALYGMPVHFAGTGEKEKTSFTSTLQAYELQQTAGDKGFGIKLWDTAGISASDKQGMIVIEVTAILKSQANASVSQRPAPLKKRMHVMALVVDGKEFNECSNAEISVMLETRHKAIALEIPCVVIVTHTEEISTHVQKRTADVYNSTKVKACIRNIHKKLQVPIDNILPVVNIAGNELQESPKDDNLLLLHSVQHLCKRAQDYIRRQPKENRVSPWLLKFILFVIVPALLAIGLFFILRTKV